MSALQKGECEVLELSVIGSGSEDGQGTGPEDFPQHANEEDEYTIGEDPQLLSSLKKARWLHQERRRKCTWPLVVVLFLLVIILGIAVVGYSRTVKFAPVGEPKTSDKEIQEIFETHEPQSSSTGGTHTDSTQQDADTDEAPTASASDLSPTPTGPEDFAKPGSHPIDDLIAFAQDQFRRVLQKETKGVKAAAQAYRERRGRHPPPGFDKWVEYAEKKKSLIIEDFFDPIYSDLAPFWAVSPEKIRSDSLKGAEKLSIRNGKLKVVINHTLWLTWMETWFYMIQPLEKFLPDMDLAFNGEDEPRVLVSYERTQEALKSAEQSRARSLVDGPIPFSQKYQNLPPASEKAPHFYGEAQHNKNNRTFWVYARETCPPELGVTNLQLDKDWTTRPPFPEGYPNGSYHGFVSNWTHSKWACAHPHLRNLHAAFINPRNTIVSREFFPFFSGSKVLGMDNDIRVPPAKYFSYDVNFSGGEEEEEKKEWPWEKKRDIVAWRGSASGGNHNENNWRRVPRIRFISMLNGTEVGITETKLARFHGSVEKAYKQEPKVTHDFIWPNASLYPVSALINPLFTMGKWIKSLTDAAFTHLQCFPSEFSQFTDGADCEYLNPYFHTVKIIPMLELFQNKYVPDIDGHGYSGRWRALLKSKSLPIKATVYSEWHDTRIFPWVHFIPMDNTFADFYSILEYFAGGPSNTPPGRPRRAKKIASDGNKWAHRALRRDDMTIYMYRLLLEYARVCDPNRERLAYVADLAG